MVAQIVKQVKEVHIISRIEFKADARKVVYKVRSSNGTGIYETTLFNGKATGCTCPARKPCYHMTQLEVAEEARKPIVATVTCDYCGRNHSSSNCNL